MRRVILESPYAGNVDRNLAYARACLRDSLNRGEAPIASHLLYTQAGVLNDDEPAQREQGIAAGLAWQSVADAIVVYTDLGTSSGMQRAIDIARCACREIERRSLPFDLLAAAMPPEFSLVASDADEIEAGASMFRARVVGTSDGWLCGHERAIDVFVAAWEAHAAIKCERLRLRSEAGLRRLGVRDDILRTDEPESPAMKEQREKFYHGVFNRHVARSRSAAGLPFGGSGARFVQPAREVSSDSGPHASHALAKDESGREACERCDLSLYNRSILEPCLATLPANATMLTSYAGGNERPNDDWPRMGERVRIVATSQHSDGITTIDLVTLRNGKVGPRFRFRPENVRFDPHPSHKGNSSLSDWCYSCQRTWNNLKIAEPCQAPIARILVTIGPEALEGEPLGFTVTIGAQRYTTIVPWQGVTAATANALIEKWRREHGSIGDANAIITKGAPAGSQLELTLPWPCVVVAELPGRHSGSFVEANDGRASMIISEARLEP